jgi:hypothetical protein
MDDIETKHRQKAWACGTATNPKLRNCFNVEGQVRQLETVPMSPLHLERHNQEASMWNSVTW